MQTTKSELGILLQVITWLFLTAIFYFLLRLEFMAWNWNTWFHNIKGQELLLTFLHGLRFDLSSLTWLSALILIGALLPWPFIALPLKELTLRTTFLLIHIPFLIFNMADIEFIHFAGRRMTPDSFYLLRESQGKLGALWETYWPLFSVNMILITLFVFGILKLKININSQRFIAQCFKSWKGRVPASVLTLILLILLARGGFQPKPLEMVHAAAVSSDIRVTHLALNSSFTMIHSLQKKRLIRLNYFANTDELEPLLNANTPGESVLPWDRKPKNVVLFILESFGLEYTGLDGQDKKSFTPFLDSLKSNSIYFTNGFANGRRSIESLPSLLTGIPSLLDEPFLTSTFQTNDISRLGVELTERGVWTAFFHGGANGTMFFQEFTQLLGFAKYYGKNEYPHPGDDDGTWGIWDGPFLHFFGDQLTQINSSFFTVFFSLSSHHPFKVPTKYQAMLPSGPLPILQSVAYTDLMLKDFFTKYASAPWFKDTLFIFTADHTSKSYLPNYQTPLGSFRVPLLLYFPGAAMSPDIHKLDLDEPAQHIDVFPTVQEIFNIDKPFPKMARSLLKSGPRKVTLYLDGQEFLVRKEAQLLLPTEGDLIPTADPLFLEWKAHRQYFINGLIDNHL